MFYGANCRRAGSRLACWLLGACCLSLQALSTAGLFAAPHTIGHAPHPYDPDWAEVYLILAEKCVSCHRPSSERADLSDYDALMAADWQDETPAIVPGKADKSYLWQQVAWNVDARADSDLPDQPEMPKKQHEWLTSGQLETLRRWINNGALQYQLPDQCNIRPLMEIDFPTAKQCGSCHPRQYEDWSRSMHAYAMHSPTFEAFNLSLIERTSGTIGTFCSRCHTPIGTALGENGSRRNVNRSRIAMEGVTCVVCHRRKDGHYKASGRIAIEPGGLLQGCVYGPFDRAVTQEVGAHPSQHRPYIKSSQFCAECHDVTSPQGIRLEEAFSEWQNSPAAKQGNTCQHCHMGPEPGIAIIEQQWPMGRAAVVPGVDPQRLPIRPLSDHTFAGPDYSLLPDTEFPLKLDWMYEKDYRDTKKLTPHQQRTLVELRRNNRKQLRIADTKRYQLLKNSARLDVSHPETALPGQTIHISAKVSSLFAGHSLPTGFTAERQLWVEIEVLDPQGQTIFVSGDFDHNADLRDEHSHEVITGKIAPDRYLLNFQNKFIALTHKGTERAVVLTVNRHLGPLSIVRPSTEVAAAYGRASSFRIAKGSLPPLGCMDRQYPVRLPRCPGPYRLSVRLNFRHLPPALLDHIGVPHLKHLLEVVVIDRYDTVIDVSPSSSLKQKPFWFR